MYFFMDLWQVWTAISAVPTAWRSYVTHYPFEEHHSNTLWYNCICPLSRLAIFIWTLDGCGISLVKDERSFVILLECGLYKLWHPYLKICVIRTGFTCSSSVIVENAIVILTLFRKEQINAVDATHTEAYQSNILTKFQERMGKCHKIAFIICRPGR